LYPHAAGWAKLESGFAESDHGVISRILTVYAVGVFASGVRDPAASGKLGRVMAA